MIAKRYRSYRSFSEAVAMRLPGPEKTAAVIKKGAEKADEQFPPGLGRVCTLCGTKLGRYNVTDQCMRHLPS